MIRLPLTPGPPIAMEAGTIPDQVAIAVMSLLMVAAFVFAVVHWTKSGRPIVMLLFIAGGCMMIMEPLVDTVAGVWFAANTTTAFTGWGRPIPLWACLTYFAYFGIGGAVIWIAMRRGLTRAQVWYFYFGEVAADFILESALLRTGLYTYYGNQPLDIGGFPLWWAAVNALIAIAAAAVTLQLSRHLSGWHLIAIVPALLSTSAAANAAAGWPAWFVINTDVGPIWTQIGGIASCIIALMLVDVIAKMVATTKNADASSTFTSRQQPV